MAEKDKTNKHSSKCQHYGSFPDLPTILFYTVTFDQEVDNSKYFVSGIDRKKHFDLILTEETQQL
jgi:hypothetical protein